MSKPKPKLDMYLCNFNVCAVVKFVKRSESEPVRSSVEEELGMMGRLRLAREVQADARDSLKGV